MKNMEQSFYNRLREDIEELANRIAPGTTVELQQIKKQTEEESYTGAVVRFPHVESCPCINLSRCYRDVLNMTTVDDAKEAYVRVLTDAIGTMKHAYANPFKINTASLTSYTDARKLLCIEVIGREANRNYLATVPHTDVEDLSIIYRLQFGVTVDGVITSAVVTNELMKLFGVSLEQLHQDALDNSQIIRPATIQPLNEKLRSLGVNTEDGAFPGPLVYAATNIFNQRGAAVMFYPEFWINAAEKTKAKQFFILPSSIHEVLLIPDDGTQDPEAFLRIVRDINATEVNATEVDTEDKLSDTVYYYDGKEFRAVQA